MFGLALRIFEVDPESAPRPRQRFADDIVGRFRSGYQISKRPAALEKWRVTTGDPEVAARIAELFGGEPQEWDAQGEDNLEVFTNVDKVKIILNGPGAVRQEMVLWGRTRPIRRCDGVEQHGEGDEGKPCECPSTLRARIEAADAGKGCEPSTTIIFRLADDPDLGRFRFASGSWSLVKDLHGIEDRIAEFGGPVYAWLALAAVEIETAGQRRRFVKPVLDLIGPAA